MTIRIFAPPPTDVNVAGSDALRATSVFHSVWVNSRTGPLPLRAQCLHVEARHARGSGSTVDIDDALLERAKRLALKEERTLTAVVSQALAAYLGSRKAADKDAPFELLVRGKAGDRFPTVQEFLRAEDDEDREALAIPTLKRRATP